MIYLVAVVTGCSKPKGLLYSDIARVQLNDTSTVNNTFFYEPATVTRDTVYIKVNTIGPIANFDRAVNLMPVVEQGVLNPAIPGVHYVPLDDPSLKKMMVVKANAVVAMIPIIMLRDPSLKVQSVRLRLGLVANDQFGLGQVKDRSCTVLFSDRLERFFSWRVDSYLAAAFSSFGKYSTGKHQFMYDTLKERVDEEWYQAIAKIGGQQHYKNLLKARLEIFNADPANLASGKAPLRETSNPTSPIVAFP
ncbi:DUF4843 domain-containing protein [Pedobacter hiemivivus]|uniref:DUF4843 domain-containing protein n=1 Tax=Pedobacter hiemivivus TaxID=2530454 RepID=A0A4R0NAQ5_9SPHI|nr:DUF4843 domain-containing protein [Pedobacter hiemivivus]TKC57262.1 DUF4843 domain-containing protein [Pedobacter hiemivivus]